MTTDLPEVTVIIPTYNRCAELKRILDSLCVQTCPSGHFEVLAVADGCTDDTVKMLGNYSAPYALRTIEQPNRGPGAARNNGASFARGRLLLFLDDDVEPTPPLIEAHREAHRREPGGIVIGPYPPVFQGRGFLHIHTQAWWSAVFNSMLQPGHRFSFRDLFSGNLSVATRLFTRFNGFDTSLQVHEDYEFGMRMIKAGVPFTVAPRALAYHHEKTGLRALCIRKRLEGRADVLMARRHPEFFDALPLAHYKASDVSLMRILRAFAFKLPSAGDRLAACLPPVVDFMERARLLSRWRHLLRILQDYWYWRGAAEELGSGQRLDALLRDSRSILKKLRPQIEIDLGEGLEAVERRLDEERPVAARIRYGRHIIGLIPHQAGAEGLRGSHLGFILVGKLAVPLLEALALEGKIPVSETIDRQRLAKAIRSRSAWFGPVRPGEMWFEQYSQWKDLERKDSKADKPIREYWDRLTDLYRETAWLEDKRSLLQRMAEERESRKAGLEPNLLG